MNQNRTRAAISAISSHLPASFLTNDQLAMEFGDWTADKIREKTGIEKRHIAAANECASDLGVAAAQKLFDRGVCAPQDIDFLLFCTQTPDYFLPSSSCLMQTRLGLRKDCGAIDVNQGCSGFVYCLSLGKSLIECGLARKALLITADTYSKLINPRDRSVRTIFGDGAAATLLVGAECDSELIGPFVFGTDGTGGKNLMVPVGGMRQRPNSESGVAVQAESGNWRSAQDLSMNGAEIFNFTLQVVPEMVNRLLQKCSLGDDAVDCYVFHQANRFMLDRLRAKLRIPVEKFFLYLDQCGNTVSSSIPIALENGLLTGRLKAGQNVMVAGFGVGYSWAAAMVRLA